MEGDSDEEEGLIDNVDGYTSNSCTWYPSPACLMEEREKLRKSRVWAA